MSEQGEIGKKFFEIFVTDRIKTNKVSLWSPMKRRKLLTLKGSRKVLKLSCKDKVIEQKEDRSLFARLMVVCKSRPEKKYKGSDWPVRVFCSSEIFVCSRWYNASLFCKERFDDNSCKTWWRIRVKNDHWSSD